MSERPRPQEPAREASIFPVSKEAADRALTDIAKDPRRAMFEEAQVLELANPHLSRRLTTFAVSMRFSPAFSEGALFVHRIIREQADLSGQSIPQMSPEAIRSSAANRVEKQRKQRAVGMNLDQAYAADIKELTDTDPVLSEAVAELSKYRIDRDDLYAGMVEAYKPLSDAIHASDMNRQFNVEE